MDTAATCGEGLAAHAPLPALMGELTDAVAEILERHVAALDPGDADGQAESEAYARLASGHRAAASQLRAIGAAMAACRGLPMATHDEQALTSPDAVNAFRSFVQHERALLSLLQARLEADEQMLAAMDGPAA